MGKMKEHYGYVAQEDYDLLAWENKNFAEYLHRVLDYGQDLIGQIANGQVKGE